MRRALLILLLVPTFADAQPFRIHMVGVGEYDPIPSLNTFRIYLEEHYRDLQITSSLGGDSKTFPNLEPLAKADVLVMFARRTNPSAEQMKMFRDFWNGKKGIVAMRTASHAFQKDENEVWDKQVLGGNYRGSGSYTAPFTAVGDKEHPILKGVGAISSRGYYGNDKLAPDADVLQIVKRDQGAKLPVSWTHDYKGTKTFYTSMGVPEDFRNEKFLRMMANAVFWTARHDPAKYAKTPTEVLNAKFPPALAKFDQFNAATISIPVFGGVPGQWDAKIRERGWIVREGDNYRMWYTGYDGTKEGLRMLGYATSQDGVTWKRHREPIYKEHWTEDMIVVPHKGKYYMFAEGKDDQAHLLISLDGVEWRRQGVLDIRMRKGAPIPSGPFGTPVVWFEKGAWNLLYERSDKGVWLARSSDLKVWTHVQDEPVMVPGDGEHEKDLIAVNQVIKEGDRYYAYYHGSISTGPNAKKWATCLATSTDLIRWEKYPHNPLLPHAENKSSGIVVHDGRGWRLYTMHPEVHLHRQAP